MSYTEWKIKTQPSWLVSRLSDELSCNEIVARLLINRGLTDKESATTFLNPTSEILYDPFLLNDMSDAVKRIIKAFDNHEKICIYGDYDVDGITSVSTLYLYLKNFTDSITYFIPDRFSHGYGINESALDKIREDGCSLVITVDTGISAINEIEYAKSIGLDVIITDHHECQEKIPDAIAVINPKRRDSTYPFAKLAGVGVVYKLISALDIKTGSSYKDDSLDLVAVGTIADIMPLLDENRYIVKSGLKKISGNANSGLNALISIAGNNSTVTSSSIGFAIAPRINAAGRMENAEIAVKLFVTKDPDEANEIADYLCKLNIERQKTENEILKEATEIIVDHDLDNKYNALVLWKEGWHSGVIGIVASKLKEKYNKPVVLFSVDKVSKGSGRSVVPFNLYEALEKCSDTVLQFGGHKYAAGVLVDNENLSYFRDKLSALVGEYTSTHDLSEDIEVECVLPHSSVTYKTAENISKLHPYGKSNEVPLFCVRGVRISEIFPTSNNRHLRIKFALGDKIITGFYFGESTVTFDYREGDTVDIVCEVNVNEYRNLKSAQLVIHDIRYSENTINMYKKKREVCDNPQTVLKSSLPTRSDIGIVYKFLLNSFSDGKASFNLDTLSNLIAKDILVRLDYEKVYYSIKILLEIGAIEGSMSDILLNLTLIPNDKRFSLEDSKLLMNLYFKAGEKFGN